MGVVLYAGAAWFGVMFALGFLLGPIRMLALEPRIGPIGAILVEAVPMLLAMVFLAPRAARLFGVPPTVPARLGMGFVGLVLLIAAESLADALLLGQMLWAERLRTTEGLIGLCLMLAFALMPLLRRRA